MRELKELRALRDNGLITTRTWYHAPHQRQPGPSAQKLATPAKSSCTQRIHTAVSDLQAAAAAVAELSPESDATRTVGQLRVASPSGRSQRGDASRLDAEVQDLRRSLVLERSKVSALEKLITTIAQTGSMKGPRSEHADTGVDTPLATACGYGPGPCERASV